MSCNCDNAIPAMTVEDDHLWMFCQNCDFKGPIFPFKDGEGVKAGEEAVKEWHG